MTQKTWPINQLFIMLTSIAILFVVMRSAADLLAPFLLSISIAILLSPLLNYLHAKHIPKIVSLLVITLFSLVPIMVVGGYIVEEASDFAQNADNMKQQFELAVGKSSQFFQKFGIRIEQADVTRMLEKSNLSGIINSLVSQSGMLFSNIFLIFFTVSFMLMESNSLHNKLLKRLEGTRGNIKEVQDFIAKINAYFIIKVKTSFVTGLWVLVVLWYYDIPYYSIWATLAFLLNFIPVIGSILAAVPAVILAGINFGAMTALWIVLWYAVINTIIGNVIEPRIMGKGLGLSVLVTFLSMTLWGWVFGPVGMILSVPLTMAMQFFFAQYEETKWVSFMLSDYEKEK